MLMRWLVVADGVIAVGLLVLSVVLFYFSHRRPALADRRLLVMLAATLLALALVHLVELWTAFRPIPWLEGATKISAAIVGASTAVAFALAIPSLLRRPDSTVLAQANRELRHEIRERERTEAQTRQTNAELEARVTERTRELERSNEELERFAYVASHDLREPLRMVKSYTQLLARRYRGKLDPTADEFIDYAVEGCDRMGELIHDVLEYSRVGRREQSEPVEAAEVLEVARQNLKLAIEESGAQITVGALPRLHCRRSDLVALLQNLVGNAIKYRGDAPPNIHVGAERREHEDMVYVRDDGIGLDTQKHGERIFGMFQRLHPRGEYGGTGMGLALCKKIVETHGGRIWVESEPGQGATFYCAFPREPSPGASAGGYRPMPA